MSLKKILIILIIILTIAIIGLVVYAWFFSDKTETTKKSDSNNITQTENNSTAPQVRRFYQISQGQVVNPIISKTTHKIKYHSQENGNIFEVNPDGSGSIRTSSKNLSNLIKVLWGPEQEKFISISANQNYNQINKSLHNLKTKTSIRLDENIRNVSWSPHQQKIAYQYYNPNQKLENYISIANPDGSNWQNILKTRIKNLIVKWPNPEIIAFRTRPSGLAQSVLYTVDTNGDNLKKIKEAFGLSVLWSPSGNKLLFSETSSRGRDLKLKIASLKDNTIQDINLKTLPDKCVWSTNQVIYCAVPKEIPSKTVLPDDFYQESVSFSDAFWKIDLQQKKAQKIIEPSTDYNATNLLISDNENYLLFVDQKDKLLYSLRL